MGRRGKDSRAATWALFVFGLLAAAPGSADAGLSALPFWPAAPMVIATTLRSGLAGLATGTPKLSWGPAASAGRLPRVKLLASYEPTFLRLVPPVLGSRSGAGQMPAPPSIQIDNGVRLLILMPDIRMTNDRRGAFLGLRGSF